MQELNPITRMDLTVTEGLSNGFVEYSEDSNRKNKTNENSHVNSCTNLAWADAMAKILKTNKPKRRKTIVLSRAKRQNELKDQINSENLDFKIVGDDNGTNNMELLTNRPEIDQKQKTKGLKKQDWASNGHVRPSVLEKGREKSLIQIATKGVVQLFNAVREHQITMEKDLQIVGSSENKKDKVLKSLDKQAFLDVLMGSAKSQPVSKLKTENKMDIEPTWSIFREDFMMSSKLKDWDKEGISEIKKKPNS